MIAPVTNPPLTKGRPVVTTDGITIPVITGVPTTDEEENSSFEENLEKQSGIAENEISAAADNKPQHTNINRKGRVDRSDARRYHTAGAIEDIKVQK
jgi:hypothetical protein